MWLTVTSNSTKRPETIIFNMWRDFGRTGVLEQSSSPCSEMPFTQIYTNIHLRYKWCLGTRGGGGAVFYKYVSFFVDYIAKKWNYCPKISKTRQFCLKPMTTNHTNKKNPTFFPMFVGWNFCPCRAYIADILTALLHVRPFDDTVFRLVGRLVSVTG